MRKIIAVITGVLMVFTLAACGKNEEKQPLPEDVNISGVDAVASASIVVRDGEREGNTEFVAKRIQETVGGDLFRIEGSLSGRTLYFLFQGAAPEKWMMEAGEYTMKRFAGLYGMEYAGMATNRSEAARLSEKL